MFSYEHETVTVMSSNKGRPQINSAILTWELGQLNSKQSGAKNNPPHSMHICTFTWGNNDVGVQYGELKKVWSLWVTVERGYILPLTVLSGKIKLCNYSIMQKRQWNRRQSSTTMGSCLDLSGVLFTILCHKFLSSAKSLHWRDVPRHCTMSSVNSQWSFRVLLNQHFSHPVIPHSANVSNSFLWINSESCNKVLHLWVKPDSESTPWNLESSTLTQEVHYFLMLEVADFVHSHLPWSKHWFEMRSKWCK